jgi:hypothetical protein
MPNNFICPFSFPFCIFITFPPPFFIYLPVHFICSSNHYFPPTSSPSVPPIHIEIFPSPLFFISLSFELRPYFPRIPFPSLLSFSPVIITVPVPLQLCTVFPECERNCLLFICRCFSCLFVNKNIYSDSYFI